MLPSRDAGAHDVTQTPSSRLFVVVFRESPNGFSGKCFVSSVFLFSFSLCLQLALSLLPENARLSVKRFNKCGLFACTVLTMYWASNLSIFRRFL